MKNTCIHDGFLRVVLSDKYAAADYLRKCLPASISAQLDFSTLRQLSDSYVSAELQKNMSDIIYSCSTRNREKEIKISLLLEYKSYPDKYTPVQLGCYLFSAMQRQLQNGEPLSVVIPVLLYHGKGHWQYRTLTDIIESTDPEWLSFVPGFQYIYNNLGEISDEQIEKLENKFLMASLLVLKHSFDKRWLRYNALRMLRLTEGVSSQLQRIFAFYLMKRVDCKQVEIGEIINSLNGTLKDNIMSIEEFLIQKGVEKGGRAQTEKIARAMLVKGISFEEISELTGLTTEEIKALQ